MDGLHFVYFADPMCSWCYGFSPVVDALEARYGAILPIRLVMGGLRPGTDKPMTDKAKADTLGHWHHVHEASGQPFDESVFDREGFVYDTDPGARATVLARRTSQAAGLQYLRRVHQAFYAEGRDVTDYEVLADLAAELGFDRTAFRAALADDGLKDETWRDYAVSQRAGVTGFPTLILGPNTDGTFAMVTRGLQPGGQVLGLIDHWLASVRPAAE